MRYNKGDKVRIRDTIKYDYYTDGVRVNKEMYEMRGSTVTIDNVLKYNQYTILEDGGKYTWTGGMFMRIKQDTNISWSNEKEHAEKLYEYLSYKYGHENLKLIVDKSLMNMFE